MLTKKTVLFPTKNIVKSAHFEDSEITVKIVVVNGWVSEEMELKRRIGRWHFPEKTKGFFITS